MDMQNLQLRKECISGNICYRRLETSSVYSHRINIHTKDNDHAGMRNFAVAGLVIWNSLPATLWTQLCPLHRLLNIWMPTCLDDRQCIRGLWCALQIYSSSSSCQTVGTHLTVLLC